MTDFKRVGLKSLTNITVLYKSSSNRFCFIDLAAICVCVRSFMSYYKLFNSLSGLSEKQTPSQN